MCSRLRQGRRAWADWQRAAHALRICSGWRMICACGTRPAATGPAPGLLAGHERPAGRLVPSCLSTPSGYYLSREWRQRRQQRLDLDGHTCQGCGITREHLEQLGWPPLQVHHKNAGPPDYRYPSFGNEQPSDLLTLCSECHDGITNSVRRQRFKLDPKKQVDAVHVAAPSLTTIPIARKQRVQPSDDQDSFAGREPIAVPQRSDRRSAKYLREGDESRQR